MKKLVVAAALSAITLSACTTLPEQLARANYNTVSQSSNFELCRTALDPEWQVSSRGGRTNIHEVMEKRGLDKDGCFRVLLSEHGSSTMCRRYQRAVARGEPTAKIGFTTDLSRQDLQRGFARNNISCGVGRVNTESGWKALGRQVDRFNDRMSDIYRQDTAVDCYEVYEGKIRCRQY